MRKVFLCSILIFNIAALWAQSPESVHVPSNSLQGGAEFSAFNPDFYCPSSSPFNCGGNFPLLKGIGVFGDFNVRSKYGAEGEARWLHWGGEGAQVESTYLIGPRYRVYQWHHVALWTRFLVGVGSITTSNYPGPDSFQGTIFVYAPGGSVDYRLDRRFALRGDYELQRWPSFAVLPPDTHGLEPNGFSLGVVYTIAR